MLIQNERIIPCDIDDTLVMTSLGSPTYGKKGIKVKDPLSDSYFYLIPNTAMIRLIKEEMSRGAFIIFWSRGGYQWAANVVQALGIDTKNALIMTKPLVYFDDKDVSEWLKDRVYLTHLTKYKNPNN